MKKFSLRKVNVILTLIVIFIPASVLVYSNLYKPETTLPTTINPNESFKETFDVPSDIPLPLDQIRRAGIMADWDVQIHSRDEKSWYNLTPVKAHHGTDCSKPPTSHQNDTYYGSVYICNKHLMTSISAVYGLIYLTPPVLVDFSKEGIISFDLSTQLMSKRDWWDLWITPHEDNTTMPYTSAEVDERGTPKGEPTNTIHVTIENGDGIPLLFINRKGVKTGYNVPVPAAFNAEIDPVTNQAATRQPFRLTLSKSRIKFERLESKTGKHIIFFDRQIQPVGFEKGIVQFGHHSYDPTKSGSGVPATWHWDNVSIHPSIPFNIIGADKRYIDSNNEFVTFLKPSPENSHLRFSAIGMVQVSLDGKNYVNAQKSGWAKENREFDEKHFSSYWMPIREGVRKIYFKFSPDRSYKGPFIAKDFYIWSQLK